MLRQRVLTAAVLLAVSCRPVSASQSVLEHPAHRVVGIAAWEWGRLAGYRTRAVRLFVRSSCASCAAILAWEHAGLARVFVYSPAGKLYVRCGDRVLARHCARLAVVSLAGAQPVAAGDQRLDRADAVLACDGVAAEPAAALVPGAGCDLARRYRSLFRRAPASAATSSHPRSARVRRGKGV